MNPRLLPSLPLALSLLLLGAGVARSQVLLDAWRADSLVAMEEA